MRHIADKDPYSREELHDLVERARRNDRKAMDELYDDYRTRGMPMEEYVRRAKEIADRKVET